MLLKGTRIVEVEGIGPGPFAGMTLADHDADVIVVHRKNHTLAPGYPEKSLLDRGKRSIELDLKDPGDVAIFKELVKTCDGLIEGFRPGVMERLGLGPEDCQAVNPRLVFGRLTGWGQTGPLSMAAGHDMNYASLSGAFWYASPAGQPPYAPPTVVGDICGGALYLVIGLLMGIMEARGTGKGRVIDAAIFDGSAHSLNLLMSLAPNGMLQEERGNSMLDGPHWSRCYRTADGLYMSVQCIEPKFYRVFLEHLGLEDDPDLHEQFDREAWPRQQAKLETIFATRTREEWATVFGNSDACTAPVLSPWEASNHPINAARRTWVNAFGMQQAAPAPKVSGSSEWVPTDAPGRGQHTEEILAELDIETQQPARAEDAC